MMGVSTWYCSLLRFLYLFSVSVKGFVVVVSKEKQKKKNGLLRKCERKISLNENKNKQSIGF